MGLLPAGQGPNSGFTFMLSFLFKPGVFRVDRFDHLDCRFPFPPQAVCCADHEHCCPQGYTCNMQTGTCEKKAFELLLHSLPQSKVVQSSLRDAEEDVSCDSEGAFRCPKQHTCCKTSATEWSCCPASRVSSADVRRSSSAFGGDSS